MSKILEKYIKLKEENDKKRYMFRCGAFYIFLNEDAKFINNKFGLKIIDFGNSATKCGFPANNLNKYKCLFIRNNIDYEIIESEIKPKGKKIDILKDIQNINMNETTFKQAFDKLVEYQNLLKKET